MILTSVLASIAWLVFQIGQTLRPDPLPALAGAPLRFSEPAPDAAPVLDHLMFKKGGGSTTYNAEIDPNIGKAAMKQAQTGDDWLKFAQKSFKEQNKRQDVTDKLSKQITDAQIAASKQQMDVSKQQIATSKQQQDWAKEDRSRYKKTFQPLQDDYIKRAKEYGSESYQNKAAGEARADVISSANNAKQQQQRQMASMGVDPRSGRYQGVDNATAQNTALAAAGAQNTARRTAEAQGMGYLADSINLGNGLPAQAAQAAGQGVNAAGAGVSAAGAGVSSGASALGTNLAANAQYAQSLNTMNQGFGGAMQGYGSQAGILAQQNQMQNQVGMANAQSNANAQSSMWSGLMGTAGTVGAAALMFSSHEYKEDKRDLPEGSALSTIGGLPVQRWKYKEGIADGAEHIGPYAEDWQKATGLGDGKTIALQDVIGLNLRATQELNERFERLEQRDRAVTKRERASKNRKRKSKGKEVQA